MLAYFIQGFLLGFPASATPGPMQAFLFSQTLKNGWRRSLPLALAPLFSDIPIVLLVVFLLSTLPAWAVSTLQIVGGLFLIYLAWGALQAGKSAPVQVPPPDTPEHGLLKASLVNLLNPNPYIFWGTIGGVILLEAWRNSVGSAAGFLLGMYLTLCGGFALFILFFGFVGRADKGDGTIKRGLAYISAVLLFGFGIFQLVRGVAALV
jgi:threonine/homoserine/homoserine lactone efflux protein